MVEGAGRQQGLAEVGLALLASLAFLARRHLSLRRRACGPAGAVCLKPGGGDMLYILQAKPGEAPDLHRSQALLVEPFSNGRWTAREKLGGGLHGD